MEENQESPKPKSTPLQAPDFESRGWHNYLELVMVFLLPFTTIFTLWYIGRRMDFTSWQAGLSIFGAVIIGYAMADLITGLVHWLADTYGSVDTPLLGKNFIEPFRWHHIDPQAMCHHSLAVTIGNTCSLAIPGQTAVVTVLYYTEPNGWITFGALTFTIATVATVFANQFHKWAHLDPEDRPWLVIQMQKMHLILNPEHHEVHHSAPYETYYCVTNGWTNWFLDKISFWRGLEKVFALFGMYPDESSKVSPEDLAKYQAAQAAQAAAANPQGAEQK